MERGLTFNKNYTFVPRRGTANTFGMSKTSKILQKYKLRSNCLPLRSYESQHIKDINILRDSKTKMLKTSGEKPINLP